MWLSSLAMRQGCALVNVKFHDWIMYGPVWVSHQGWHFCATSARSGMEKIFVEKILTKNCGTAATVLLLFSINMHPFICLPWLRESERLLVAQTKCYLEAQLWISKTRVKISAGMSKWNSADMALVCWSFSRQERTPPTSRRQGTTEKPHVIHIPLYTYRRVYKWLAKCMDIVLNIPLRLWNAFLAVMR